MDSSVVTVRFWAGARAAAGVEQVVLETLTPLTLDEVTERVVARVGRPELRAVVASCSVLVDDRPAGSADPATFLVRPGQTVEMLPPFAGG